MLSHDAYAKVYRISAWYDLIVSWPFALFFTLTWMWGYALEPLNAALGFAPLPAIGAHTILFANFFGSVVVVWSVVRLWLNDPRLGLFDGIGRFLFSLAMVNALLSGITPLVWCFLIPEFLFAVLQVCGRPRVGEFHGAAVESR